MIEVNFIDAASGVVSAVVVLLVILVILGKLMDTYQFEQSRSYLRDVESRRRLQNSQWRPAATGTLSNMMNSARAMEADRYARQKPRLGAVTEKMMRRAQETPSYRVSYERKSEVIV